MHNTPKKGIKVGKIMKALLEAGFTEVKSYTSHRVFRKNGRMVVVTGRNGVEIGLASFKAIEGQVRGDDEAMEIFTKYFPLEDQ